MKRMPEAIKVVVAVAIMMGVIGIIRRAPINWTQIAVTRMEITKFLERVEIKIAPSGAPTTTTGTETHQ